MLLPGRLVFLRPAAGQGAQAPAQLLLQRGQGCVFACRPAGAGAEPQPRKGRFVFRTRQPARPAAALLLTRHVPQPSRPVQRAWLGRQIVAAQPAPPARAGPRVVLGPADHARPHGVPLDVANRRPVTKNACPPAGTSKTGPAKTLRKNALGAHLAVVLLGVPQVDRPEHRSQGGDIRPSGHKVDMACLPQAGLPAAGRLVIRQYARITRSRSAAYWPRSWR